MKLTKQQLKQIIKEELEVVLTDSEAKEFFGDDVFEQNKEKYGAESTAKGPSYRVEWKDKERIKIFDYSTKWGGVYNIQTGEHISGNLTSVPKSIVKKLSGETK